MASFLVNSGSDISPCGELLHRHYVNTGFIYPDKEKRIGRFGLSSKTILDKSILAPSNLYHVHIFARSKINASVSAFQDTKNTVTIQHASSKSEDMEGMFNCLLSACSTCSRQNVEFASMFFTPGNRWPTKLVDRFEKSFPKDRTHQMKFNYGMVDLSVDFPMAVGDFQLVTNVDCLPIVEQWQGTMRSESLGIKPRKQLGAIWETDFGKGYRRQQFSVSARDSDGLAACAIVWESPHILNLSHLCTRAELFPNFNHPRALQGSQWLAMKLQNLAKEWNRPGFVLLVPSKAEIASQLPGFFWPGKEYSHFLWPSDGERGFATNSITVCEWYSEIRTLQLMRKRRNAETQKNNDILLFPIKGVQTNPNVRLISNT